MGADMTFVSVTESMKIKDGFLMNTYVVMYIHTYKYLILQLRLLPVSPPPFPFSPTTPNPFSSSSAQITP